MSKSTPLPARSRRGGPWYLGALLVVALGVTGLVTYRAYVASRQEKAVVNRVLQEYVSFASYQLGLNTRLAIHSCLQQWFSFIRSDAEPATVVAQPHADCANTGDAAFDIDFRAHTTRTAGREQPTAHLLRWLQDTIPQHPAQYYGGQWSLGVLVNSDIERDELIAYAVQAQGGHAIRAVGFVSKSSLEFIRKQVVERAPLLPQEFTKGLPTSAFFETSLAQPSEPAAFASSDVFAKRSVLGASFGDLVVDLRLNPAAIERIVPGGIPRDRGLDLFSLFAVAAGLVLTSLLLLRREAQLARERAGFVSSVSHELRTPLAQIRMFAEMLLLGRVRNEADRRRALEIIDKESRRLSHLVDNVLQVARSERGAVRVNPEEIRLAPVIRETVEGFMVLVQARQIQFQLDLEENLVVSADREAVRQIVLNLLDNAAKYGPEGQHVVVGLALFNDTARVWVDDEGPGIPLRERERVFETFYRSRRDLDSHITGSGIGLGVVRELAALHGGTAWVEEAPGGGARVVVEFPGASLLTAEAPANAPDWAVA